MSGSWIPLKRNYTSQRESIAVEQVRAVLHPLLPHKQRAAILSTSVGPSPTSSLKVNKVNKSIENQDIIDPLTSALREQVLDDPLSNNFPNGDLLQSPSESPVNSTPVKATLQPEMNNNSSWVNKKAQIVKEYAFTGNMTLKSSAIEEFDGTGVEDGSNTRKVDLYTQRLASLTKKSEDTTITMSQKEYEDHISRLRDSLNRAWANDERVGALKIVIKLSKLLGDTSIPKFYPYIFVKVIDVLEQFGEMVFSRLKSKAEDSLSEGLVSNRRVTLPFDFKPSDIPISAKETCRNWFYKTACIRELLPRVYVEIALLKCYKFLTDSDFPSILSRIASIIRGIGDPLVAFYLRTFLIVAGEANAPGVVQHAISMTQDVMITYKKFKSPQFLAELDKRQVTLKEYFNSLSPSVEWLIKFIGRDASKELFQATLYQYREQVNDAMMLKHIIDSFDAKFYSHASLGMATLIKSAEPSRLNVVDVFACLGKHLLSSPPPENQRLPLLNDVWKSVTKCEDISSYVRCTFAWLDTVQVHYTERETLILLADLSSRLQSQTDELPESVLRQLESIISNMISKSDTLSQAVLTSDHLIKVLDAFKGPKKVNICKDIFEAFRKQPSTSDAIMIHTLFDVGRVIHDSFDYLSSPAENRALGKIIIEGFINKIDFGRDLEQQLSIYVECRAVFCNLDIVIYQLVQHVSHLAIKALKFVKGKHNKKTIGFVKACLAYCHISIPSIADTSSKLYLQLHCAEVALLNNCLPQTDTFLKAAISMIPELPAIEEIDGKKVPTEDKLASFVYNLLAFLVVVPGHPQNGPFYIVHGLLNALPKYPWPTSDTTTLASINSTATRVKIFIEIIGLLATYAQAEIPYKIDGIDSNDTLYAGNPAYKAELNELISTCVEEALKLLTTLNTTDKSLENVARLTQSRLILHFVMKVASCFQVTSEISKLEMKLLELIQKQKSLLSKQDLNLFRITLDSILVGASFSDEEAIQQLVSYVRTIQIN